MPNDNGSSRFAASTAPILLVEDDLLLRDALVVDLESLGLRVLTAENGVDALALAREVSRPSLIVLDLNMPVMDGFTFRAHQVRDPNLADVSLCQTPPSASCIFSIQSRFQRASSSRSGVAFPDSGIARETGPTRPGNIS